MAFQCWVSVIIAVLCSLSEQGSVQHDWAGDAMDSASMGRRRASTREFTLSISSSERERWYVTRTTSPNPGLMRYDISMCKYKACRTAADNIINSFNCRIETPPEDVYCICRIWWPTVFSVMLFFCTFILEIAKSLLSLNTLLKSQINWEKQINLCTACRSNAF